MVDLNRLRHLRSDDRVYEVKDYGVINYTTTL